MIKEVKKDTFQVSYVDDKSQGSIVQVADFIWVDKEGKKERVVVSDGVDPEDLLKIALEAMSKEGYKASVGGYDFKGGIATNKSEKKKLKGLSRWFTL
jgi:hypothetical protein